MAKITQTPNLQAVTTWQDLRRFATTYFSSILQQINGNLDFVDNISAQQVSVTFSAANSIVPVAVSLGAVPTGFIVIKLSAPMIIYQPAGSNYTWLANQIFLQSNAAGTATLYII